MGIENEYRLGETFVHLVQKICTFVNYVTLLRRVSLSKDNVVNSKRSVILIISLQYMQSNFYQNKK